MPATAAAPARPRRARRVLVWAVTSPVTALLLIWVVAANNPSLAPTGLTWESDSFLQQDRSGTDEGEAAHRVAWDQPAGAWASVVVRNDRPYPVTLSPGSPVPGVEVRIAAFDPDADGSSLDPELVEATPHLRVPSGGDALVSIRVSDRCLPMGAASSVGSDTAWVDVTTFGITSLVEVPFPATYLAGTTVGHSADPACVLT